MGVEREALTESSHTVQATLANRVILGIQKTVGNHISDLAEGLNIKTARGQCSSSQPQATGDEG